VLVGAPSERKLCAQVAATTRSDAIVAAGQTNIGELIALLSLCDGFAGNDSGAMHLAAAVGVPVTAIFGPTDERVTSPLGNHDVLVHQVFCRPCMLRDCPIDHRCMKGITVDAVFDAVSARLAVGQR
jgi:heptosyltransferase-2